MNKPNSRKRSKTDWQKVDAIQDNQIDYSDIPELTDAFFKKAVLRLPKTKDSVTLRLDHDVLTWFKKQGKGYQTRINAVLKAFMKAHSK